MTDKMYDALRYKFEYQQMIFNKSEGTTQTVGLSAIVIYAKEPAVFVEINLNNLLFMSSGIIYAVCIGEDAHRTYNNFRSRLNLDRRFVPSDTIPVSQEFIDWAKALQKVYDSSQSLVDLLEPKQ